VRHRIWNSLSVLTIVLVVAGAFTLRAFTPFGIHGFWVRYGPQLAITVCVLLVAVGMIGRIAHVRDERDRERLARGDSERPSGTRGRTRRPRAATATPPARTARGRPGMGAFRSVFERLLPLLRLESAALVAYGFHGFDLLLAEPISSKPHYTDLLAARMGMMKGLARTQAPVQLQLGNGEALHLLHAVVPLPIRAPGVGRLAPATQRRIEFHRRRTRAGQRLRPPGRATRRRSGGGVEPAAFGGTRCADRARSIAARSTCGCRVRSPKRIAKTNCCRCCSSTSTTSRRSTTTTAMQRATPCCARCPTCCARSCNPPTCWAVTAAKNSSSCCPAATATTRANSANASARRSNWCALEYDAKPIRITVSVGVATRLPRENEPAAAVARADQALYAAKRGGRNRVNVAPAVFT
jgi:hypothetical protein